jgi:hypothetical protein
VRQQLTRDDIGGWLFKCNPREWDIEAALRDGQRIDSWRVRENYRLSLIRPGDPAVVWVTGSAGANPEAGIWAVGYTTGDLFDGHGGDYWVNEERGQQLAVYAGLLMWPIAVVPRERIAAHPATNDLEILRQAQISNPSYLTPEHHEAIASMVELWPSFS